METRFEERWIAHDKRFDESMQSIKSELARIYNMLIGLPSEVVKHEGELQGVKEEVSLIWKFIVGLFLAIGAELARLVVRK